MEEEKGYSQRYLHLIERTAELLGNHTSSTAQLLAAWADWVAACERGYRSTYYEYENELSTRDFLERILSDPEVQGVPELEELREKTAVIDTRFRAILIPIPQLARIPCLVAPSRSQARGPGNDL